MNQMSDTFQNIKDGRVAHYLYNTHSMMVRRCYDPQMTSYPNYGMKSVSVCGGWLGQQGFWTFVSDMGERPEGMSLDRINPQGDYSPDNCRWACKLLQANNTRLEPISSNSSGMRGVHWCKRDLCWIVQISLNKKRVCVGRFSLEDADLAEAVYLQAKELKVALVPDESIYEDYVLAQRVGTKKTKMRRNKSSEYWGVSYSARKGRWIASTTEYIGISSSEEGAHQMVQKWLEGQSQK